jgi:hypothetical protein
MRSAEYTYRTIQNYLLAVLHFVNYLMSPLPPTATAKTLTIEKSDLAETKDWLITQKKWVTPLAIKQCAARNSLQSLKHLKKWLEFSDVLVVRDRVRNAFDIELDSIIKSGNAPSVSDCYKIRNMVMVLLYTYGMPLRSQNLVVSIAVAPQPSFAATKNTIIIRGSNDSLFEFVTFKNQRFAHFCFKLILTFFINFLIVSWDTKQFRWPLSCIMLFNNILTSFGLIFLMIFLKTALVYFFFQAEMEPLLKMLVPHSQGSSKLTEEHTSLPPL